MLSCGTLHRYRRYRSFEMLRCVDWQIVTDLRSVILFRVSKLRFFWIAYF